MWELDEVLEQSSASIVSCEHDLECYERMSFELGDNVELTHRDLGGGKYEAAILEYSGEVEIIVIDGRHRVLCVENSVEALTQDGVILFDNADRDRYKEGVDFLVERGFRRIDLFGMAPIGVCPSCTRLFYRPGNCLGI